VEKIFLLHFLLAEFLQQKIDTAITSSIGMESMTNTVSLLSSNFRLFAPILDLLRTGELIIPPDLTHEQIKKESQFYMINLHSSPANASDDDLANLISSAKAIAFDLVLV
jgi:hypothetical protein